MKGTFEFGPYNPVSAPITAQTRLDHYLRTHSINKIFDELLAKYQPNLTRIGDAHIFFLERNLDMMLTITVEAKVRRNQHSMHTYY